MNHTLKMILLISAITGYTCFAQTNQSGLFIMENDSGWQKAITTHRLSQFPKIHKDGRVWFQFKAPETAQSVKLHMEPPVEYDLQKDASGLWNVIVPNPRPGYQVYWMLVDGTKVYDPGSDM
ncbi:MAG: hypothetical protein GXY51_11470, partial [Bacteroidetes bacterium]|nr:hypothetical protein [Bacteroidota bacterium]